MESVAQTSAPGYAFNGDHGREAIGNRSNTKAFVATYAVVSKHANGKTGTRKRNQSFNTIGSLATPSETSEETLGSPSPTRSSTPRCEN